MNLMISTLNLQNYCRKRGELSPVWIARCEVQARGEYGQKKKWEMRKENVEQILKIFLSNVLNESNP